MAIKAGSVVVLKSGSVPMTVTELDSNGYAKLIWFVETNCFEETMKIDALKLSPEYKDQ